MPRRFIALALTTCIAALVAAGCGKTVIDEKKAAKLLREGITAQGVKASAIKDVSCPSGVEVKKGKPYACITTLSDGSKLKVNFTMLDDKGTIKAISAVPTK